MGDLVNLPVGGGHLLTRRFTGGSIFNICRLLLIPLMIFATSTASGTPSSAQQGSSESAMAVVSGWFERAKEFAECSSNPWLAEAERHALDPLLVYSIALTESRTKWSDGWVRPCPYCLRVGTTAHRPATKAEAVALMREGIAAGERITDVGVMQVNAHVHGKRVGGDVTRLLDVRENIRVGAEILAEAVSSSGDLSTGLGRYHSWTPRFGEPYGNVALRRYLLLKQQTKGSLWPQCNQFAQLN